MTLAGLRPGEKLYEEKLMAEEGLKKTPNDLIHIGCPIPFEVEGFLKHLQSLMEMAYANLFISTDQPEEVYTKLKAIPQITKLLRSEEDIFLTVSQEEREFLENLLDEDPEDVVRLSKVTVNEEKEILTAEGPLRHYVDWIVKKKLRLRCVNR